MPKKRRGSSNSSKRQKTADRMVKRALRRERREARARLTDDEFVSFNRQLQAQGLRLKDVPGDGNCLFRALSDQLDGGRTCHSDLRQEVVRYIRSRRDEFEPFLDEDEPFEEYVAELSKDGVYAGNHAIVAFARHRGLDVVIHQLSSPCWEVRGVGPAVGAELVPRALHIAYLHGEHYCSVRPVGERGQGTPSLPPAQSQLIGLDRIGLQDSAMQSGQVKLPESQSLDDSELHALVALTHCKDTGLAQQCLLDCGYDLDLAVPQLLQLMEVTSGSLAGGGSGHEDQKLPKRAGGGHDQQPSHLPHKRHKQQAQQVRREAGPVQQGRDRAQGLEERIGAMSI